jgi:hypothetical protein
VNLHFLARISAHTTERKNQMTKMKILGALIIVSATIATPVLAQQAGKRGAGSPYDSQSQSSQRGAYNQVNGPSNTATQTRDHWNPENTGNNEKDPSMTGGEDTTRHPSSS